ncbi:MAG: alpha-amylase family glycosyl hydrolase, partial [Acidobacteriota bacterium]|nr:alpha-amylase family glycosyl hydrolase [Acidobacteriota bacterium]
MSFWPRHPTVYEINTWAWLEELSRAREGRVTLGDVPRAELERLASLGFAAVWLMGVWERSPAARAFSRTDPSLREEYARTLPDFTDEDIVGSPYAIRTYRVDLSLGGDDGLADLRARLSALGLRLVLDFVPNHMAIDHPWVASRPELLVQGDDAKLSGEPQNYFRAGEGVGAGAEESAVVRGRAGVNGRAGEGGEACEGREACEGERGRVFAHGRDPYFAGWRDTVQLDYRRAETRDAMTGELLSVASKCDGVRCDMAMLVTREVFTRTWGAEFDEAGAEFWPEAIKRVRAEHADFIFMAEVYWDMEYRLQQQGFDFAYDKRLYDRLLHEGGPSVRAHLRADLSYQNRLARFVENHDEPRALAAFGPERGRAASALALTLTGLRLLHEGQLEGRRTKLSVHLGRRPQETADAETQEHYRRLLAALAHAVFHEGEWRSVEPREAWAGNPSHENLVASLWTLGEEMRLVAVNLS